MNAIEREENQPLVSCIMPTYNRRAFVPHAIRYFLRQDYKNKELIIIDDGTDCIEDLVPKDESIRYIKLPEKLTLGAKLNMACEMGNGNIIMNWDDDDWYASHRIGYQTGAMDNEQIYICGINTLLYFDLNTKNAFQYIYPANERKWLIGSSQCYRKDFWAKTRFAEINVGMDGLFVWATLPERIKVLENNTFSIHMIHDYNVSPKNTNGAYWNPYPVENIKKIMNEDWNFYFNNCLHHELENIGLKKTIKPIIRKNGYKVLKNVFACLVHENEDCIIDLVRNLHYHDPDSLILLYNGSENPDLLSINFPFDKFGAIRHPSPTPQKHGHLHGFALDCMEFTLEFGPFDLFTIVDSDQLAIRSNYSQFLTAFFTNATEVGLLSSNPERVNRENHSNQIAKQAYHEFELWKPLLDSFPNGYEAFVHWTFWPSSVFSFPAVKDLIQLVKGNKEVKKILSETKIWASEEVIFPTLIKLLGYEIAANPCSYKYVQYKKMFSLNDAENAILTNDVFWIHPVERKFNIPLRKFFREQTDNYISDKVINQSNQNTYQGQKFSKKQFIDKVRNIEGWLSDSEASLLLTVAENSLSAISPPHHIVEVGSYHGKSTVLFGSFVKAYYPQTIIYAIDPHDGKLGAVDQGLLSFPPSLERLKKNIENAELIDIVKIIVDNSFNVEWDKLITILFIDGLHDYYNVSRDFQQFSDWIRPGGYVIFHDYIDYFPGVKLFVNELILTGIYQKFCLVDSLMVLQKHNEISQKARIPL